MTSPYAFATLLTSDHYLPGALALAAALRDLHPTPPVPPEVDFQTVCIVTPETVDVSTVKLLRRAYDVVVGVEVIAQEDTKGLELLGRTDLNTVLTKLHVFRLTQFQKIVFLDADVLPIRPLSHLFTLPDEFSAVPDVGWPDIFNSGVMVLSPGEDKFTELNELLKTRGTWDGGDQGLLNEWRGGNWNRLSFTYNTTPTAAYTYAPAYERFGSRISAIHFIGPNKPWSSLPYRAPGSGTFEKTDTSSATDAQQPVTYDYGSLVDRWYAVYDKHYRAQAIVPETEFEVRRYVSAWDEQSGTGAEFIADQEVPVGGALGLDDLKRLAIEGLGAAAGSGSLSGGEGEYHSMPLEGRVDLMRPKPEPIPEIVVEQAEPGDGGYGKAPSPVYTHAQLPSDSSSRFETLPTPGPDEIPAAPHLQALSLPPSAPATPTPQQHHEHHHQQHDEHNHHEERPRPLSPPLLIWNPAVESPPKHTPSATAFPTDTYFPNVWDQAPGQHHDATFQSNQAAPPTTHEAVFFQPPPPAEIPEQLLRQGHYSRVTGPELSAGAPIPNPEKVKSVFPWEQQPRHMPGRVFPSTDAPPPGTQWIAANEPPPDPRGMSPPEALGPPPIPRSPPVVGLPTTFSYVNAWDNVPSIQKYASRLVRPPQHPSPLSPAFDYSRRRRDSDAGASSQDGDVEDEVDDSDASDAAQVHESESEVQAERTSSKGKQRKNSGSRTGSRSPRTYLVASGSGKKKEYRTQGVQTVPKETRNQAVQVSTSAPVRGGYAARLGQRASPAQTFIASPGELRGSSTSSASVFPAPGVQHRTDQSSMASVTTGRPSIPPASLPLSDVQTSGMRSPREFTYLSPVVSPERSPAPPLQLSLDKTVPRVQRVDSNETPSTPPSSIGPLSPPEGQPVGLPASPATASPAAAPPTPRKAGRVFDPARGVDVFKRGSEEVLARFLRMGSWEEESNQAG